MEENGIRIGVDRLPLKAVQAVEETGVEHFVPEVSPEEKSLALLRRIDFGVEEDVQKGKASNEGVDSKSTIEYIRMAQQELLYIVDCIDHVVANEAVTVAGMSKPKPQPNEVLSDLAVCLPTKLKTYGSIAKYMKQSAKALEEQVAREARFYGALMRLQRNWKVKRQRLISAGPGGNAGFTIDLSDHISTSLSFQTSSFSVVNVDQDKSGKLSVNRPGRSNNLLHIGFQGGQFGHSVWEDIRIKSFSEISGRKSQQEQASSGQELEKGHTDIGEGVDEGAKLAHSVLREIQYAVSDEKVFNFVIREALNPNSGIIVTGIRENFVQLRLGPEVALTICLQPYQAECAAKNCDGFPENHNDHRNDDSNHPHEKLASEDMTEDVNMENSNDIFNPKKSYKLPNPLSSEVHLQQILHQYTLGRHWNTESQVSRPVGVLKHFCMSLSHRIYCYRVLSELENLVRVPYLHLYSHPTWHSRISSWYLYLNIPHTVMHGGKVNVSEPLIAKKGVRSQFCCKIIVHDEQLSIEAEGTPNVGCLFRGNPAGASLKCEYSCGLSDLASMLLQQMASQLIHWLHEEALVVGMKVKRDYLSLSFQVDDGDSLSLVASIAQRDYCIIWWLILSDAKIENGLAKYELGSIATENKKYLGPLSLEALYDVLMDLVTLCGKSGEF